MKKENLVSWAMLSLLFLYMFALNHLMPMHRDDYEYALVWGTFDKIVAWPDVFQSLYNHYLTHGGRMIAFFVLDSFMLIGKQWFDPFNAFLFVALMILIYWHSQRSITFYFNPYILLLIIVFSWVGLPHFAEVNIWMTGACVYLMTAVLIFGFLLPYHFAAIGKPLLRDSYLAAGMMFLGGIAAGWTIENTAATMNVIVAGFVLYAYWAKTITKWMISGFSGSVLGFLLLVIAPGSYVRYAGTNTPFIYHLTNQLAAVAEMLLYILPIVIFMVLVWRILLVEYAKARGNIPSNEVCDTSTFDTIMLLNIGIIIFMILSYTNAAFFSKALSHALYYKILVPLGFVDSHLKVQLFNTLSGLEEVVIYLLTIIQIYRYTFKKGALRKKDILATLPRTGFLEIMNAYPICYYVVALIIVAMINNLFMIASPSFPARATFGSVVFLIIGAASAFTIPEIRNYLLGNLRSKYVAAFAGLVMIALASATFYQHMILERENNQRMIYVNQLLSQGVKELELEPLSIKNRVLRHVYFVELNNGVSKYGFCRYYQIKDVHVKERNE